MASILTAGVITILVTASFHLGAQEASPISPGVSSAPVDPSSGPPGASVDAQLQALVDKAVTLGFPDSRGADIYVGTITVHYHGQAGEQDLSYGGAHAHLRDGRWMVQLAYPLSVSDNVTTVDSTTATLVTDKSANILHGFEKFPHPHPHFAHLKRALLGPDDLPNATSQDHLGGQGAACAVLIGAGIHQSEGFPYILSCLLRNDGLVIGPNRLMLCTQPNASSATIAAHDHDIGIENSRDEEPSAQTVLTYALSAWFAMNIQGLPTPFSALPTAAAQTGAIAMLPPEDIGTRNEVRLRSIRGPTGTEAADAVALHVSTWRATVREAEMDATRFSQIVNSEAYQRDPHAIPDWAKPQFAAYLASRFDESDLPSLFALAGDLRPSGWVQAGHRRTIGDQALRAIASVLGFDPRILVRHPIDTPWNDDERLVVATDLARWWATHAHDTLAQIRADAVPHMNWMQIGYLLKVVSPQDATPLYHLLAQKWSDGPPDGFDDIDVLEMGASYPEFDRVSTAWPVTGPSGPFLAFWRVKRGLPVAIDRCLDSALACPPSRSPYAPTPHDVLYAIAYHLDADILDHLHELLASNPLSPQGEALLRCGLAKPVINSTVTGLWYRPNFNARLELADEIVGLSMLSQLLSDLRPLPDHLRPWAESLEKYQPSGYALGEPRHGMKIPKDVRIADCAATQAIHFGFRTLAFLNGNPAAYRNPPQDIFDFDANAPIDQRDARLARLREYAQSTLSDMLTEYGIATKKSKLPADF